MRTDWLVAAALLVAAAVMYSTHLTGDLYGDETSGTFERVTQSASLFSVLDPFSVHPPVFFFLAKVSYMIVGEPWALRLPSLIFAIATAVILPFVARAILGDRFFFLAAFVGLFSPFVLDFSVEARSYTMVVFLSLAALWSFVRFVQTDSRRDLLVLLAMCSLGLLTHYFFALEIVFLAVAYLLEKRRLPPGLWKYIAMAAGLVVVAVAALVLGSGAKFASNLQGEWARAHFSPVNFLARLPVAMAYGYCTFSLPRLGPARNVTGAMLQDNWLLVSMMLVAFSGFVVAWLKLWREGALRGRLRLLALGVFVPVVLAVAVGEVGFYLPREKHLAVIWGAFFLLQLLALARLARSWLGRGAIGCHLLVVAVSCFHYLALPDEYSRRMNWTGLNTVLEEAVKADDCLAYYHLDLGYLSMGRLSVLQQEIPTVKLNAASNPQALEQQAVHLDQAVQGRIFLVDYEEGRNVADPSSVVIDTLAGVRTMREQRFGRNLILFTFGPRSQERERRLTPA